MLFTILFWNIWLDNQLNGEAGAHHLLDELDHLVKKYQPDCICLNEVLQATDSKQPFVVDLLKERYGYIYNHYAPASPLNDDWSIGAMVCSRIKISAVADVPLCKDSPAKRRGFDGFKIKAISAKLVMGHDLDLNLIVAHPPLLRPYTLHDHYEATAVLEKLIRSKDYSQPTILVGDFNEPGFMPKAFKNRVADAVYFRTGTKRNPTWRHKARKLTPIRANLDQLYWTKNRWLSLEKFEVVASAVSDHRPLFASFQYPIE